MLWPPPQLPRSGSHPTIFIYFTFSFSASPLFTCVCVWKENIIKAKSTHTWIACNSGYLWIYYIYNINYDCTTRAFSGRTRSPQPNDIQSQLAIVTGPKIPYTRAAHPPPFPLTSTVWSVKGHWLTWRKWRHHLEIEKGIHIYRIVNKLHRGTLHGPSKNSKTHTRASCHENGSKHHFSPSERLDGDRERGGCIQL